MLGDALADLAAGHEEQTVTLAEGRLEGCRVVIVDPCGAHATFCQIREPPLVASASQHVLGRDTPVEQMGDDVTAENAGGTGDDERNSMTATGLVHVVAAVVAVAAGAMALAAPKGLRRHVLAGRTYTGSMLVLNIAALVTYEETGGPGIFHALAIVSLATLVAGLAQFRPGRTRDTAATARHAIFMAWSYVGLISAGASQLAAGITPGDTRFPVLLTTLATLAVGGFIVHTQVPKRLPVTPDLPTR